MITCKSINGLMGFWCEIIYLCAVTFLGNQMLNVNTCIIINNLPVAFTHILQNQQPGAEEAFKILGHAFDLIGDAVS